MKRHPRAYLLMGVYDGNQEPPDKKPRHAALLKKLAMAICRHGPFAVTTLRNFEDGDFALAAVEHRADADRLTRAVKAHTAPRFGPWRSHRSFTFDAKAYSRISALLVSTCRIAGTA
ncbi:MAG: hypothetical protein ACHQK9_25155 [Reyranellales bacterium]